MVRALTAGPRPIADWDRPLPLICCAVWIVPTVALLAIVSGGGWETDRRVPRIIRRTVEVSSVSGSVDKKLTQRQTCRVKISEWRVSNVRIEICLVRLEPDWILADESSSARVASQNQRKILKNRLRISERPCVTPAPPGRTHPYSSDDAPLSGPTPGSV